MSAREEILSMKPIEKIHLIDELLLSLNLPEKEIDTLWENETESRIEAYNQGKLKAVSESEVFSKYHR